MASIQALVAVTAVIALLTSVGVSSQAVNTTSPVVNTSSPANATSARTAPAPAPITGPSPAPAPGPGSALPEYIFYPFNKVIPPSLVCNGTNIDISQNPANNIVNNTFSQGIPSEWSLVFGNGSLTLQTEGNLTYVVAPGSARNNTPEAGVGIQLTNLDPSYSYYYAAWVRAANSVNSTQRGLVLEGFNPLDQFSYIDGPYCVAPVNQVQESCWSLQKGAFSPNGTSTSTLLRISLPDPLADVQVYGVAVIPVSPDELAAQQTAAIDQYRKTNVTMTFQVNNTAVGGTFNLTEVRSGFYWGIQDIYSNVATDTAYQNFVINTFKATILSQGDSGWPVVQPQQGVTNFSTIDNFNTWANQYDLPIIGPYLEWEDLTNGIPQWVQTQVNNSNDPTLFDQIIDQYTTTLLQHVKGNYTTITADNENLHGTYIPTHGNGFETVVNMFSSIKAVNSSQSVTFNDYNIAESCYYNFPDTIVGTQSGEDTPLLYIQRIQQINSAQTNVSTNLSLVNVAGLEFQVTQDDLQAQRFTVALDYIGENLGLPIHINELSLDIDFANYPMNRTFQAVMVNQTLYQLFSNQYVEVIMLQNVYPNDGNYTSCGKCLFDTNYQPNEAGNAYLALRAQWQTKLTNNQVDARGIGPIRIFKAEYALDFTDNNGVKYPTQMIMVNSSTPQNITVNLA